MKQKDYTRKAKLFLNGVDLDYITSTINKINFSPVEKKVLTEILDRKSIKEISINENYSMSYIAFVKNNIYKKISAYLLLSDCN